MLDTKQQDALLTLLTYMRLLTIKEKASPPSLSVWVQGARCDDAPGAVLYAGQEPEADLSVNAGHLQEWLHQGTSV